MLNLEPLQRAARPSRYFGPKPTFFGTPSRTWTALRDSVNIIGHISFNMELLRKILQYQIVSILSLIL